MGVKTRLFCFTNFNLDFDYDKYFHEGKPSVKYIICGRETCPNSGRVHDQGFVYFKSQRNARKNDKGKWFSRALGNELGGGVHNEACNGTLEENCDYCEKDGNVRYWGERPAQGFRTDLDELSSRILNGETTVEDVACESPYVHHMYGRTLSKLEDIALRKKYRTWMTTGVWYHGPTGVGKSHRAFADYSPDTHYVYPNDGGWWDGYTGQAIVIINEFRGGIRFAELLDLCDKWPKTVKRRNREPAPFLAQKIIITSSMSPKEIYYNALDDGDSIEQLYRRFNIIELAQKWSTGNTKDAVDLDLDCVVVSP